MPEQPGGFRTKVLTIAFGVTVAMWAAGYLGHMPLVDLPPPTLAGAMLTLLAAGGWFAGRYSGRGLSAGSGVGLVSAVLNLLIFGSLLARPESGELVPHAWLWIPGWIALSVLVATLGSAAASILPSPLAGERSGVRGNGDPRLPWLAGFAWITCAAALLLITAGGLVTGFRAGMAVPDWPNTFHSNMFLYPLTKMTGGVFYEHAHRLLGTLVGLSTLVLATCTTLARQVCRQMGTGSERSDVPVPFCPLPVKWIWLMALGVIAQGIFGGFRVTDDSHCLAVLHGCFAHAILGGLVAVAATMSSGVRARAEVNWENSPLSLRERARVRGNYEQTLVSFPTTDRLLTALAIVVIFAQTVLGTLVRQLGLSLLGHIAFAAMVALITLGVALRVWGHNQTDEAPRRCAIVLMCFVVLQLTLGIISVALRTPPVGTSPTAAILQNTNWLPVAPLPALLTTAHQTTAALILASAVALAVWTRAQSPVPPGDVV
jgi:heme a synthase